MPTEEEFLALQQELEQVKQTLSGKESEVNALLRKRDSLIVDNKKRKAVDRLAKVFGLDPADEEFEDKVTAKFSGLSAIEGDPKPPAAGTPQELPTSEIEKLLAPMKQQLTSVTQQLEAAEAEKKRLAEENKRERIERTILDALNEKQVNRPQHLLKLIRDQYKYDEETGSVYTGSEYEPVDVKKSVELLE